MENNNTNWELLNGFRPFIKQGWVEAGFEGPTPIQEKTLPLILEGKDVIGESPTGTGKTLAYLLPLIEKIDLEEKNIQVLILAPSHELVMQIYQVIQDWTKGSGIESTSLIGGANVKKQIDNLKKKPQIVVGSVGRIIELINLKKLKMHKIKTIVVDEFDVLIAQEHVNKLNNIIKTTMRDRQLLFFSATLSDKTEEVAKPLMKEPQVVQVARKEVVTNTEHIYVMSEERKKIDMLSRVISTEDMKVLVFIQNSNKLDEIEAKLLFKGINLGIIAGKLSKSQREDAIKGFRSGKYPVLVVTDVSARGLDIEGITHVINLDLPFDMKQYIHRAGRTGRMGKKGTVISIVTNQEGTILKRVCRKAGIDNLLEKKLQMGKLVDAKVKGE